MSVLRRKTKKSEQKHGVRVHAPLGNREEVQGTPDPPKYEVEGTTGPPPSTLPGITAMQWARELSKLPQGDFHLVFFPYSRKRDMACARLTVKKHCRWRTQMPREHISIAPDNLLLFTDGDGEPRMCYRILIRYMAFSHDGYKLHRIEWL